MAARQRQQIHTGGHGAEPSLDPLGPLDPSSRGRWPRGVVRYLWAAVWILYFTIGCLAIHLSQLLGLPLALVNHDLYDAYVALTKQMFALLSLSMMPVWMPTVVRASGDASVAGQIRQTPDGGVEYGFPERAVLIANHQLYTDWMYLWSVGYANNPHTHGHIYIILKESLRYVPILGPGMALFGFIFMSRKMAVDRPRLAYRLSKLAAEKTSPAGKPYRDPMWLLLFPEGTNIQAEGKEKSAAWARKVGVRDTEYMLLPRSAGLFFSLNQLAGTVEYLYDCTVAYEGIPRHGFGEDFFTLAGCLEGRSPKSVNFYWRRFRVADIPLVSAEEFDRWLRARWAEKDALMDYYFTNGRFPASESGGPGFVEAKIGTRRWWEFTRIFYVVASAGLALRLMVRLWGRVASLA